MNIIGKTTNGYIVEASADELAKAAGFTSPYDPSWPFKGGDIPIGSLLNVAAAYNWHSRVGNNIESARQSAHIMRALADMIEGSLPDVIIANKEPQEIKVGGTDD